MTRILRSAVVLGLAVAVSPPSPEARGSATGFMLPQQHRQSDEEVIRALVEDSTRAWNAGDAAAYAARFAIDVEFTDVTGLSSSGRKAFEARQDQLFRTIFQGSRLQEVLVKVAIASTPSVSACPSGRDGPPPAGLEVKFLRPNRSTRG